MRSDVSLIVWGTGAPRNVLDVSRLEKLGWKAWVRLWEGAVRAHEDVLRRQLSEISQVSLYV